MSTDAAGPRTYGNWVIPTKPGLSKNLTLAPTVIMFTGMIVAVGMMAATAFVPALVTVMVTGSAVLLLMLKDRHGDTLMTRISARASYRRAKSAKTNTYRAGPLGRGRWGTFQLPGIAAATRLSEHKDSYDRPFALVYTPRTKTYTVVIRTDPDGASRVDPEQIDLWVSNWGHWLARLGVEPGLEGASVTIETAPDSGTRLRQEVGLRIDPNAPALAQQMLLEAVESYPAGSSTVRAFVALTFSGTMRRGSKTVKDPDEMGRLIAARLVGLTQTLQATGAGYAEPLTAEALCEVVRVAYDPSSAKVIERARTLGESLNLTWPEVGPAATESAWVHFRHDSAVSSSWTMSSAPYLAFPSTIRDLLEPHAEIDRKRVTLFYRPQDPAKSRAIAEADVRNARVKATSGRYQSAAGSLDLKRAVKSEVEQAEGAAMVNFGLVVTATVNSADRLSDAKALVDTLAASCSIHLRPAWGSQDSAFAASLPLGLNLASHVQVPAQVREAL